MYVNSRKNLVRRGLVGPISSGTCFTMTGSAPGWGGSHGTRERQRGRADHRQPALSIAQAQCGFPGLRALPCHQRGQRLGRRVPLPAPGVPDPRHHLLVLPVPVPRVLLELSRQPAGILLPAPGHAELPRAVHHRPLLPRVVLPHRGHLLRRLGPSARGRRRRAAGPGLGGVLHALAAPLRLHGLGGGGIATSSAAPCGARCSTSPSTSFPWR